MSEISTQIDARKILCDAPGDIPKRQQAIDEELRQAVGQNALLHTEIHRRLTDHILRLRDEVGSLRRDMESLQRQNYPLNAAAPARDDVKQRPAQALVQTPAQASTSEPKSDVPPDQIYAGYKPEELEIIKKHFRVTPPPAAGFITDSLGVKTRGTSLWDQVQFLVGTVIPPPIPNDFHAEAIEWIGLLKSVDSARGKFVAMELGAGWGPWVVAGAVAARNAGIRDISLLAVEGDPGHFAFLRQHFLDNGLHPDQHLLFQAAVGVQPGRARWPRVDPRNSYGTRPITGVAAALSETLDVEVLGIATLLAAQKRWDLVHVDVQGSEVLICEAALALLNERTHWLIIGTHSRLIDGQLVAMFVRAGWVLENEKPVIFAFQPGAASLEAMTRIDGTQVWRNPRLD
jgi:FkbM family methyltransferase